MIISHGCNKPIVNGTYLNLMIAHHQIMAMAYCLYYGKGKKWYSFEKFPKLKTILFGKL